MHRALAAAGQPYLPCDRHAAAAPGIDTQFCNEKCHSGTICCRHYIIFIQYFHCHKTLIAMRWLRAASCISIAKVFQPVLYIWHNHGFNSHPHSPDKQDMANRRCDCCCSWSVQVCLRMHVACVPRICLEPPHTHGHLINSLLPWLVSRNDRRLNPPRLLKQAQEHIHRGDTLVSLSLQL